MQFYLVIAQPLSNILARKTGQSDDHLQTKGLLYKRNETMSILIYKTTYEIKMAIKIV
jgi:hypothetical protein